MLACELEHGPIIVVVCITFALRYSNGINYFKQIRTQNVFLHLRLNILLKEHKNVHAKSTPIRPFFGLTEWQQPPRHP
jgi:hypothetical protein